MVVGFDLLASCKGGLIHRQFAKASLVLCWYGALVSHCGVSCILAIAIYQTHTIIMAFQASNV